MRNATKNVILVCALSAVAIMCVGLFLYDYVPTGLTVSKAKQYETDPQTTELLSEAQEAQDLMSQSSSSGSAGISSNVIIKEYTITKTDIAMAKQVGIIDQGRPDPFAEVVTEEDENGQNPDSNNNNNSGNVVSQPGTTTQSDGTFYNTAKQK